MQILNQLLSCCCDKGHNQSNLRMREFGLIVPRDESIVVGRHGSAASHGQPAWPEQEAGNSILYCKHRAEKTMTPTTATKYKWYNAFYFKACLKQHTFCSQATSPKFFQNTETVGGILSKPPSILTFNIYSM